MSTELAVPEISDIETRQERALRRTQQLHNAFQSAFEVLAEIYRDEDWRYINDLAGRPYTGFTAFVQDQLGCAASNARRYQQGIVGLILPLQEVAAPGARIPVTSSDVARLGITGARVVVESAPAALDGVSDPAKQTEALRDLIDSVAKRSTTPGCGPTRESSTPDSPLGALVPATLPVSTEEPAAAGAVPRRTASGEQPPCRETDAQPATSGATQEWGTPPSAPAGVPHTPQGEAPAEPSSAAAATPSGEPDRPALPTDGPLAGADDHATAELESAIDAVLTAGDPTALAQQLSGGHGAALAPKCLASGQRLVRLGQLLRSLG
jgi:hypothetical protein